LEKQQAQRYRYKKEIIDEKRDGRRLVDFR